MIVKSSDYEILAEALNRSSFYELRENLRCFRCIFEDARKLHNGNVGKFLVFVGWDDICNVRLSLVDQFGL